MGLGGGRSASERCLPPTPRPLRSASAPFRAYRRAIGTIFGLPFFATRPLPDVLHLQTPVCKERHVGEGATNVMRVSRKPYLLHVGTRETRPKRSGEAGVSWQTGLHEFGTGLSPLRGDPTLLVRGGCRPVARPTKKKSFHNRTDSLSVSRTDTGPPQAKLTTIFFFVGTAFRKLVTERRPSFLGRNPCSEADVRIRRDPPHQLGPA